MSSLMTPGKVVRFTRWYARAEGSGQMIRPGNFLWGLATTGSRFEPIVGQNDFGDVLDQGSSVNWVIDDHDIWDVPSSDEWPPEVCVFMAQRALTGD